MGRSRAAPAGLAVIAVALLVAAIAGCGGGGNGTTGSSTTISTAVPSGSATTSTEAGVRSGEGPPNALGSPAAVRAVVETVLTSTDPADACGRYVTRHYLWVAYGGRQACVRAQRPGIAATSLSWFRIEREDGHETAVSASTVLRGGPYDGSKVEVGLIFDAGHYRVNALGANVPVGP